MVLPRWRKIAYLSLICTTFPSSWCDWLGRTNGRLDERTTIEWWWSLHTNYADQRVRNIDFPCHFYCNWHLTKICKWIFYYVYTHTYRLIISMDYEEGKRRRNYCQLVIIVTDVYRCDKRKVKIPIKLVRLSSKIDSH